MKLYWKVDRDLLDMDEDSGYTWVDLRDEDGNDLMTYRDYNKSYWLVIPMDKALGIEDERVYKDEYPKAWQLRKYIKLKYLLTRGER